MLKRLGMLLAAGGFALASMQVASAADPFTLSSSSFKDGAISSVKTVQGGLLTVYEVSAAVSGGMSGGPTVNLDGEVVGVNSFGIAGETQPFNFVRPAAQRAELLAGAGVDNEVSETTTAYRDGLRAYWDGDKADAVAKLSAVVDEQPSNALAADYLDQAEALPEPIAEESDSSGAPVLLIVAGGVALLAVAAGVLALVLVRRGRKTPPAPPYPPTRGVAGMVSCFIHRAVGCPQIADFGGLTAGR